MASEIFVLQPGIELGSSSIASADMDFNQLEAFLTAQTKKQGGITPEQAAVISKFWKSHKTKIRESLMNQSRWDSGLRGLSWRVDGKSQSRHSAQIHTPVAIMELEIGKSGQKTICCGIISHFSCVQFFATLVAHQAPLSVGFYRQEYWSG
ncbi:hypothetical protein FD754_000684 [Muntiacus muntjak]|uniref:COMM domain-containing protein 1 n=1 Tax=Muntiacus muntjak TaxID=9888 RepID=A0A5N3W662_MUNMU|nr:hypothetical protein FD754_000684 [Muntiacus muntjak]